MQKIFQDSLRDYFRMDSISSGPAKEARVDELALDFDSYLWHCRDKGNEPSALGFFLYVDYLDGEEGSCSFCGDKSSSGKNTCPKCGHTNNNPLLYGTTSRNKIMVSTDE